MEELCTYLVKSSGLIALFYLAYHFLLRKETFFSSNRWFLQLGLCTAIILPLLVFTKTVIVETSTEIIDWSKIPASTSLQTQDFEINWYVALGIVYGLGVLLFLAKFILDFYSLKSILKGKKIYAQADYKFIDTTENVAPFSYFETIVYNSSLYSAEELANILDHEKIHCDQNHTVDVLISRVFCVLFWFNPIIWLYKKAILQNLEFIADHHATWKLANKKSYQITLLKITTQENCVAVTNHFYQSLIKKRIVMLNKNQSKKRNSWKYAVILPALVAFVFLFQIEVVAQEKGKEETTDPQANSPVNIAKKTTIEKDTINKIKTILTNTIKNKGINENTEIYIDGKKVTQNELDTTNFDDIATVDVIKNNNESIIKIVTVGKITGSKSIFNSEIEKTDLGFDDIDPNNVSIRQKTKDHYTVTKVTKEVNGVPADADYYIDGKKVSPLEAESMSPNHITSIDVQKEDASNKNSVRILTKSYINGKAYEQQPPMPPTPPKPPTFNFKAPEAPNFPKPPVAPKGSPEKGDKKAWIAFEQKMKDFDKKMVAMAPQMEAFDKKMADFDKQMKPFNEQMEIFEQKMKIYEKQIQEYQAQLQKNK